MVNIIENLINGVIKNKNTVELIELANKVCDNRRYFANEKDFSEFLESRLDKAGIVEFLLNSEIGYSSYAKAQYDNEGNLEQCAVIDVILDKDGNPTSCYIPSYEADVDDTVICDIKDALRGKLNSRIAEKIIEECSVQ